MKKRNPNRTRSSSKSRNKTEVFHGLSNEILRHANLGVLRTDFLRKVSKGLIETSGCDSLELWVKEQNEHFHCTICHSKKKSCSFKSIPCALAKIDESSYGKKKGSHLEKLSFFVIDGHFNPAIPFFTEHGSFWTGNSKIPVILKSKKNQDMPQCKILIGGDFRSVALIPLRVDEQNVGLLQLKSKKEDFFNENSIKHYEEFCQTLGIALAHQHAQIELRERIKELTCLYGIAQEMVKPDTPFEDVIQNIVELLPPAWLFPEIASARIVLNEQPFMTSNFQESPYKQTSNVVVDDECVGFVEVAYAKRKPNLDEGPFLTEERKLIDIVAREMAHFFAQKKAEEEKSLLQDQLRHADRLATIGQLAAGVAHELNEPLTNILGFAQLTQKSPGLSEQVSQDTGKIVSACLHAREVIKKLMVFARQMPPQKTLINLNEIADKGLFFFEARCAKAGIDLIRHLDPNLPEIMADPGQLNQALVNLVVNAEQSMPDGGNLTVKTHAGKNHVSLIVEDTGVGMDDEIKKQIFVPFFTTKDVHEGTGLGLPVVHGIVTAHQGSIKVESKTGVGSRFEIQLPIREA